MYGLQEHRMMDAFTSFGCIGGGIFFIIAIVTGKYLYLIPGLIIIFSLRLVGYFLDRRIERQEAAKYNKRR